MSRSARFGLAGLESGVSGALVMLLWLGIASVLTRRSFWWVPNLVATTFYGDVSLRFGFGRYTFTGLALSIFVYGLLGLFLGSVLRDTASGPRLFGITLAASIVIYYLLVRLLWKSAVPLANLYSPDRQILIGHLLYGLVLARFPRNASRL